LHEAAWDFFNHQMIHFYTSGSIITGEDLLQYTVRLTPATKVTLNKEYSIYTPEVPSGGVILAFILNVLDGKSCLSVIYSNSHIVVHYLNVSYI